MLTSISLRTQAPLTIDPASAHAGLGRVFAAAVVSSSFRDMLLTDPERALEGGYMGTGFGLSAQDAALLVSINATTLPELAQQVVKTIDR